MALNSSPPPSSHWVLTPSRGFVRVSKIGACELTPDAARELAAVLREVAARAELGTLVDEPEALTTEAA